MKKIAINGFGRIGRNVLRAYFESQLHRSAGKTSTQFKIIAINDLGEPKMNAHLLKYDTAHGEFAFDVAVQNKHLLVDNEEIQVFSEPDPTKLPWKALGVDLVLECTGFFTTRDAANSHLKAGAKKVLVSAPGTDMDATIVFGVNDNTLLDRDSIVSNASCTTNCLAPIAKTLNDSLGIDKGLINTVHAYTNDQRLIDVAHPDPRRARAAGRSVIPSKTGAAAAIGLVVPELAGRLDGLAVRIPVLNVSLLDLTLNVERNTTVSEVNQIFIDTVRTSKGVLQINNLPLVSSDFNHNPASSIVDVTQTMVNGNLVKILAWYDNEWGFSNRMLDTTKLMLTIGKDSNTT